MNATILPAQFAHLTPWVADWALTTERDRYRKLHSVTLEQLRGFYDAMLGEMDAVMTYLKTQPIGGMAPDALNLFHLAMTFAETAHPIDLGWKDIDFPAAFPWERMEFRSVSTQF